MNLMDQSQNIEREVVDKPDLTSYLNQAVDLPRKAFPVLPKSFTLGDIGSVAYFMAEDVILTGFKHEIATVLFRENDTGKFDYTDHIYGNRDEVVVPLVIPNSRVLTVIHSHTADTPVSITDLGPLLVEPSSKKGLPAIVVSTNSITFVIAREVSSTKVPEVNLEQFLDDHATDLHEGEDSANGLGDLSAISHNRMSGLLRFCKQNGLKVYTTSTTSASDKIAYEAS